MSAPPSPNLSYKKRDRPQALDIPDEDRKTVSDGEIRYNREHFLTYNKLNDRHNDQLSINISLIEGEYGSADPDGPASRSGSATSSLDPYYFGIQSPSDSPVPFLPTSSNFLSTTPEYQPINEPITPARNPAAIDRRGLVGVGELATPRWAGSERSGGVHLENEAADIDGYDMVVPEDVEDDGPDSPWTIEAVDGELSDTEEPEQLKPLPRPLRSRPSMADESGGEEILYPRNVNVTLADYRESVLGPHLPEDGAPKANEELPQRPDTGEVTSPPSAFVQPARRAKKRTSDEFEMDQTGALVSKRVGTIPAGKEKSKDEKLASRKHRSLNVNSSSSSSSRDMKGKERRRESSGLTINSAVNVPLSGGKSDRHVRQTSASSTSSNHAENLHSRRVHNTDFSHLPPSPSSSSIQQFLRHTTSTSNTLAPSHSSSKDNLHSSPNVAHSLLRGTQEGWSGLDDEATAEALRKLDGLSGKGARARASVGSFGRPSSSSRPGTPASKSGAQWEGVNSSDSGKNKRGSGYVRDTHTGKDKEPSQPRHAAAHTNESHIDAELPAAAISGDEQSTSQDKTPKKTTMTSARTSFTPKRGSTSSTTYGSTPTTSSRDSASISTGTSLTSVSITSGRQSSSKGRRNSASSDISSIHSTDATLLKDRVAHLAANGEPTEDVLVPPVPPLPKDLSSYRSPPATSTGLSFPSISTDGREQQTSHDDVANRTVSLEVPSYHNIPEILPPSSSLERRQSQHYSFATIPQPDPTPPVLKTPSKKWSFSSALNLRLSSSPSSSSQKSSFPLSPRSVTFGQQLRKSTSKEQTNSSSISKPPWSPKQPEAMTSAGSLASLSSIGSMHSPVVSTSQAKTPDRGASRPGTSSSASTNNTTSALSAPQPGPLSPTSSVQRGQSKRLTPSSIPFFRRSSSQSMQLPPPVVGGMASSSSPTLQSASFPNSQPRSKASNSSVYDNSLSTCVPGTAQKKSSVLSLGLPSLLKSSSRRSLHTDAKDAAKELQKLKDAARDAEKEKAKLDKEKLKKEDKDRSESRISVLISRKRGKTLSSTDPRKPKSPVNLPPMQISAIEPVTAQRVAKLKSSTVSSASILSNRTSSSSSRLTSQTVSSMQKQSDSSLRSRNQLPTIAGSPSVGTNGTNNSQTLKDGREPPSSLTNTIIGLPKETPTKIPRISSRTSAVSSPQLKHSASVLTNRRASTHTTGLGPSANSSPTSFSTNEFGVMENEDGTTPKVMPGPTRQPSIRGSPSTLMSRPSRQASTTISSSTSLLHRKGNRDSVSFIGLRKSSTSSVTSISTPASTETAHHRFSALSPSKGLKLLAKPTARSSNSTSTQNIHQAIGSPSSSRQSLSTPSPVPSSVDEEELLGDEEMLHYIRRQQAKKLASGATQEELDDLLKFPEPIPPNSPTSPLAILKGSQAQHLSEYERKEILDYPSVYCIGAKSKKKPAVLDNSMNNYGYDDERGDYLVVNHDHLAYRYEVIDTLGKGSFGQVLHCRDYSTGESVAIKIIRNKKRFHHQALVEIKILDNLRKWDADEKHHVIKMTEHFYFRNHLCIAMELLSINLYELIKANGFVGFTTALIRRFTSQMLMSLTLMRHHRIVHCDLKPENVLLRHPAKSAIKVIDFGSSCFEHEKIYTYIQSRFYRSPEVILGMNYHMAIDMWSLGCILAELYTGFPIFPGENEQEQLSCIMEVLGIPEKEFVNRSSRKKLFFDTNGAPRAVINSKGRRRRPGTKTLSQVLRCNDEEFVDFISKCLVWDPERRIKPQAAMRHPFVTAGRRLKPPPSASKAPASSLTGNRSKQVTETPKKSLIGAPTPLTARSSRTATNGGPTTPSNSHASTMGSSRSYRSQAHQGLASLSSSRTLSGFTSSSTK